MELAPRVKLAAAVARLTNSKTGWMPYFASALTMLIRIETREIPTLAVSADGRLFWNPDFVARHAIEILAMGLGHETLHVVLRHHARAEALGVHCPPGQPVSDDIVWLAELANKAEDACINEQLRNVKVPQPGGGEATLPLPAEWIYPETLKQPLNLTMEERFRLLRKQQPKRPGGGGQGGQGGAQGQGQGGAGQGQGSAGGKPGKGGGAGQGQPGVGSGQCGSCSGHPTPGEPRGEGGKADGGRSPAEMDRIRRQVAEAIRDAAQGKGRGTVPAELQRWADEELTPPKVDWRTKLQQIARNAIAYRPGAVSLHWRSPSRRQGGIGYGIGRAVLPALHAPIPRVGVIVDTSGSMGADDIAAAVSEVQGILSSIGAEITVVACDAATHAVVECATITEAAQALKGGGGTDMRPAFASLAAHKVQPEVVIVLTDTFIGDGYPHDEPNWCRTIWVGIGAQATRPCPWGEYVHVDDVGADQGAAA